MWIGNVCLLITANIDCAVGAIKAFLARLGLGQNGHIMGLWIFFAGEPPGRWFLECFLAFCKLRGLVLIFLRGMSLQPCDLPRGRPILSVSHTQRKLYKPLLRILQTQPVHAQKNTARCNGCPLVPIRTSVFLAKDAMSAAACGMSGETSRLSQIAWGRATAD